MAIYDFKNLKTKYGIFEYPFVFINIDGKEFSKNKAGLVVSDIEVEIPEGQVCALIVPGPCRILGLVGRKDDYRIPWNCIRRIGPDIILVDVRPEECCFPRHRENSGFFQK